MTFDEKMMALALKEARKGFGRTSPNPMVGAVVVKNGEIISKGYHQRAGGPHAEVNALRKAGKRAEGATIYVTLEPCNHYGRTPPCTQGVLNAGVKRVVIAQMDPNPRVEGGGAAFLESKGLEVVTGILGEKAAELNRFFNKYITTGKPYVIVKSAATMDGKLASRTGSSKWVTGEKAREYVHRIRDGVDAIMVGRNTVEKDDPTLNTRLPGKKNTKDPVRIVLDSHLKLHQGYRVFNRDLGGRTIIACLEGVDAARKKAFEDSGVDVLPLPALDGKVSLDALIERLGAEEITSLLIEGGGEINYAALIREKIADRILFFFAPKIIGGAKAPSLVDGEGLPTMDMAFDLQIEKIRRLGKDLLIEATPKY